MVGSVYVQAREGVLVLVCEGVKSGGGGEDQESRGRRKLRRGRGKLRRREGVAVAVDGRQGPSPAATLEREGNQWEEAGERALRNADRKSISVLQTWIKTGK